MRNLAASELVFAKSRALQYESRRLVARSRELVHDAGNLLLAGRLRRLKEKRAAVQASTLRRAA